MTRRLTLDAALIAAIAILGYINVSTGLERSRLAAIIAAAPPPPADFRIGDRSRRHVQAIRTLDPHQFAWLVHLPPGTAEARASTGDRIAGGDRIDHSEMVVRIGFRELPDAGFAIDARYDGHPATSRLGDAALGRLLRGRWDQLVVEQAGRDRPLVADSEAPTTLLRLALPPDLIAEARATLSLADWPSFPVLYEFTIGPTGERL